MPSTQTQILKAAERTHKLVERGEFAKAFKICQNLFKNFPREPLAKYLYAVKLGDFQDGLSAREIEKNRKKAAALLESVVKQLGRLPEAYQRSAVNEYYWFSRQPVMQYELGRSVVRDKNWRGYYSMGVGATMIAQRFFQMGQTREGKLWAKKAIQAWDKLHQHKDDYFNTYSFYARAKGLLGDYEGMEKALARAAKLLKKNGDYQEFMDVRHDVVRLRRHLCGIKDSTLLGA